MYTKVSLKKINIQSCCSSNEIID